jgi:hypothetical protein
MWYGTSLGDDAWRYGMSQTVPMLLSIIWNISDNMQRSGASGHMNTIGKDMYISLINGMLGDIENAQSNIGHIKSSTTKLQDDIFKMHKRVNQFVSDNNIILNTSSMKDSTDFTCECSVSFKRQSDLTRHKKKCKVCVA